MNCLKLPRTPGLGGARDMRALVYCGSFARDAYSPIIAMSDHNVWMFH